jgi:hypothetical protein
MKVFSRSLLALIVAALVLAPIVCAQDVENEIHYTVTPGELSLAGSAPPKAYDTIRTGETDTFSKYVLPLTSSLMVDANWGDASDSLALTIIAPDQTVGTFYDSSDGTVDGRILLRVSNPGGYLTMGTWKFGVYGASVDGVEDYSFVAY